MQKNAPTKHQHHKALGARILSRAHWLQFNDRGNKFFFNLIKQKQANKSIDNFFINNQEITDIDIIKREFPCFYEDLFTSEDSHDASSLREQCRGLIPKRISDNDAFTLNQLIPIEEIEKAINSLNNDKALGLNRLLVEFYKANNK